MRVSVITPLYNQAQFIEETILSVLNQEYQDWDYTIINDASTDNSLDVAQHYQSLCPDRIKIISHAENQGLPATRNTGIKNSTGEFVLPLDSDDRIRPDYLSKTVARMLDGVGMVSTWMHICPVWDMVAYHGHSESFMGAPTSGYPIFPPTKAQILNGNSLSVCSLLRREMLTELGNYPEDFKNGSEDWALWAAIVTQAKWKIEVVQEYLFHYRVHKDSMCRSAIMAPFPESLARIRAKYGQ